MTVAPPGVILLIFYGFGFISRRDVTRKRHNAPVQRGSRSAIRWIRTASIGSSRN